MGGSGPDNWFQLLNSIGIIGGLFFTAVALHSETKTRRVANLLTLTTNHREIWKEFSSRRDLSRVLDESANLLDAPLTPAEEEFAKSVVLHLASVYYARTDALLLKMEGLRRDVKAFLTLPIPSATWEKIKSFQNDDFARFVEECRNAR